MELFSTLPLWGVASVIFLLRIIDVSLGTVRTLAIVHGRAGLAVVLGFVEVSIWLTAVTEAVAGVGEHPILIPVFAGGFAAGNAAGILLERRLAIGSCVVRMISSDRGSDVAQAIRPMGDQVTVFRGTSHEGDTSLIYARCRRRDLADLLGQARAIDADLFYAVDRFAETRPLTPTFQPTGWRSVLKKK